MGIKRVVDMGFWTDDKVIEEFSPEDKLFFLYLLTNPHSSMLGVYKINPRQMAFELGYSVEAVKVLLDRFEVKYKVIKYSTETKEIAVKNYLRYGIVSGGKPVLDRLRSDMKGIRDLSLLEFVFDSVSTRPPENETIQAFIISLGEYLNVNENEDGNGDGNGDGESYHDSYDDSYHDSSPTPKSGAKAKKEKPVKHKHGEYKNVLLTDAELEKLKTEFFDWEDRIERLSSYVASTGKSYKSHYATIRNWARKDAKEHGTTPGNLGTGPRIGNYL